MSAGAKTDQPKRPFPWRSLILNASLALLLVGSIGGAVALIWFASTQATKLSPEISLLKDVFLFVCSLIATLIISHWYAKMTNTEKVDTIAERSTEKMVLLSLQIEDLNSYLKETIEIARTEGDSSGVQSAVQAFTHRIAGASNVLEMMARSNDAFRSDWLGVVSGQMRQTIEKKYDALRVVFAEKASAKRLIGADSDTRAVTSGKLDAALRELPASALLSQHFEPYVPVSPAIRVSQVIDESSTSACQKGSLRLDVLRDIYKVTGTGKFTPRMLSKPWVELSLKSRPAGLAETDFKYAIGVGTNFDFNVFLKSEAYGQFLPKGVYEFTYTANLKEETSIGNAVGAGA